MTNQDFLDQFYLRYDEINTLGAPGYEPPEIAELASIAQETLVIDKIGKLNRTNESFEESYKRTEDLGNLVTYKTYTSFGTGFFNNSITIDIPNSQLINSTDYSDVFWLPIYENVNIDKLDCNNNVVKVIINDVKHIGLNLYLNDPYKKPYLKNDKAKVLRVRSNNVYTYITDSTFTITRIDLGYIRKPKKIDFTVLNNQVSELADLIHKELLEYTLKLALKTTRESNQLSIEENKLSNE
jgi:hypothetical protein